jgi:phosphoadenosine phosphosulfate reductase
MPQTAFDIDAEAVAAELEPKGAREALEWAFETFHPSLYIACSFQKTSSVVIDIATKIAPDARFFYLDTDVLFPETYETRNRFAEHFGVRFDSYRDLTIEEQAAIHGDELWKRNPDACCGLRKVEPMRRALTGVDAWVAGIRRGDSASRANAPKFGWDKRFGLWKLNPLAAWSERDVWSHIREHRLPYNPLHDQGYPSIGCTHCTQPVGPGGEPRDGRWVGTAKSECGIN